MQHGIFLRMDGWINSSMLWVPLVVRPCCAVLCFVVCDVSSGPRPQQRRSKGWTLCKSILGKCLALPLGTSYMALGRAPHEGGEGVRS